MKDNSCVAFDICLLIVSLELDQNSHFLVTLRQVHQLWLCPSLMSQKPFQLDICEHLKKEKIFRIGMVLINFANYMEKKQKNGNC